MSEEILINVTPQETRVAVVENGVLQEGEAGFSRMLALAVQGRANAASAWMRRSGATCIRAAKRPHTDVRAGDEQSRNVPPGMAGTSNGRRQR